MLRPNNRSDWIARARSALPGGRFENLDPVSMTVSPTRLRLMTGASGALKSAAKSDPCPALGDDDPGFTRTAFRTAAAHQT